MTRLNDRASTARLEAGAQAATDVTGFGLIGHLLEMLRASGVGAEIDAAAVPILPGARDLAGLGHVPGGTERNRTDSAAAVAWGADVDEVTRLLLCDAQTSGGLLISVGAERVHGLTSALRASGHTAAMIGRVVFGETKIDVA